MSTTKSNAPAKLEGAIEDLKRFDAIEVHPVNEEDGICEEGDADYWSVYFHYNANLEENNYEGGIVSVADLPNKEAANALAEGLEAMLKAILPPNTLIAMH